VRLRTLRDMQGMASGFVVVAAFAVVAWAAGFVAVRLYRMSRRARPGGPGPAVPDGASEAPDV
jgi:hypothetical protein